MLQLDLEITCTIKLVAQKIRLKKSESDIIWSIKLIKSRRRKRNLLRKARTQRSPELIEKCRSLDKESKYQHIQIAALAIIGYQCKCQWISIPQFVKQSSIYLTKSWLLIESQKSGKLREQCHSIRKETNKTFRITDPSATYAHWQRSSKN